MAANEGLLTIAATAARLGQSEATVRRRIAAGELPAVRVGGGKQRARMRVVASALEQMLEVQRFQERVHEAGMVVGRGGGEAFLEKVEERHGAEVAGQVRQAVARHDMLERLQHEMHDDPVLRERFEQLDDEQRIEEEARELARRIRREEEVRRRALQILEEEDGDA